MKTLSLESDNWILVHTHFGLLLDVTNLPRMFDKIASQSK